MKIASPSPGLRGQLHDITETGGHCDNHAVAFEELRPDYPHTIEFAENGWLGPHGFNCFMFALDIRHLPGRLVQIAKQYEEAHPSSTFVVELIADGLEEIDVKQVCDGCIIMYFDGGLLKHAGIVRGDSVVSKWGLGHVWRHPVFEVPASYGNDLRFFRPPPRAEVLLRFEAFVNRLGL